MNKEELINKVEKELNRTKDEIISIRKNILNLDITEDELDYTSKLVYARGVLETYSYVLMLLKKNN